MEQPPDNTDPALKEYLFRHLNNLQNSINSISNSFCLSVNDMVTGTIEKLITVIPIKAGIYSSISAIIGCDAVGNIATLILKKEDGTVILSIQNSGTPAKVTSPIRFNDDITVYFYLVGNRLTTNAFIFSLQLNN